MRVISYLEPYWKEIHFVTIWVFCAQILGSAEIMYQLLDVSRSSTMKMARARDIKHEIISLLATKCRFPLLTIRWHVTHRQTENMPRGELRKKQFPWHVQAPESLKKCVFALLLRLAFESAQHCTPLLITHKGILYYCYKSNISKCFMKTTFASFSTKRQMQLGRCAFIAIVLFHTIGTYQTDSVMTKKSPQKGATISPLANYFSFCAHSFSYDSGQLRMYFVLSKKGHFLWPLIFHLKIKFFNKKLRLGKPHILNSLLLHLRMQAYSMCTQKCATAVPFI